MSAKSNVPSSGRMYLSATSSIRSRSDRANARPSRSCSGRGQHALARLERELRVHRHQPVAQPQHRIYPLTRREPVLHFVGGGGQDLTQQLLEPDLPQGAAEFGNLEQLLDAGDGLAHALEALRRLPELPQPLAHVQQQARLIGAALGQGARHLLLGGDELVEAGSQVEELLLQQAGGAPGSRVPQDDDDQEGEQDGEGEPDRERHPST